MRKEFFDWIRYAGDPEYRDKVLSGDKETMASIAKLSINAIDDIWSDENKLQYKACKNQVLRLLTGKNQKAFKSKDLQWGRSKIVKFILYRMPEMKFMIENLNYDEVKAKRELYDEFKGFFYMKKGAAYISLQYFCIIAVRFGLFFGKRSIEKKMDYYEKCIDELTGRDKNDRETIEKDRNGKRIIKLNYGVLKELVD